MKIIISCLTSLAILTSPFQGHCSYKGDREQRYLDAEDPIGPYLREFGVSKCFFLIDLIEETTDKAKQDRLKTILEVDLRYMMDQVHDYIEGVHDYIEYQTKMRDEGHPSSTDYWDARILECLEAIEMWNKSCTKLEQLIEQYTL